MSEVMPPKQDVSAAIAPDKATSSVERRALKLTLWGNVAIVVLGVVFALKTRSEAIFLDGLFSSIHLIISLLSLRISHLIQQPEDERFPFGYALFEPFLNLGKGLAIALVALFALGSAVIAILHGGRSIEAGVALWYALIAAVGCLVMAVLQYRWAQACQSQILELDFKNWLIDGVISGAVAIAFALMLLLKGTAWEGWIPYADPVLVMLLVLLMLPLPLQTVIQNGLQMVGRSPELERRELAEEIVAESLAAVPHEDYHVRQTAMGRQTYIQVYLCVTLQQEESYQPGEIDRLRARVYERLRRVFPCLAMDLVVTCDRIWVDRAVMPA